MAMVYGIDLGTYGTGVTRVMGGNAGAIPSAKYKTALNEAGSAEFTLPPGNPGYDIVEPMKTTVQIAEIDDVVWTGRITRIRKDFRNQKVCTCEGSLAFLNDSIQPYRQWYNKSLSAIVTDILTEHNRQVPENRRIIPADITAKPENEKINFFQTNGQTSMRVIQDLLDEYEGYIYIWLSVAAQGKQYFYWLKEWTAQSTQPIAFGSNLLDLAHDVDLANVTTCIFPQGEDVEVIVPAYEKDDYGYIKIDENGNPVRAKYVDEDGNPTDEDAEEIEELPLTLDMVEQEVEPDPESEDDEITPIQYRIPTPPSDVTSDPRFIDSAFVGTYGRIIRPIKFNGVTTLSDLRAKAVEWLNKQEIDGLTLDISAADLRFIDRSLGDIRTGKKVTVTSAPHGVSQVLTVTQVDCDMTKASKRLTIGKLHKKNLSDIAGRSGATYEVGMRVKLRNSRSDVTQKDVADGNVIFIPA